MKFCFHLSFIYSKKVILDNQHYLNFVPDSKKNKAVVIPYGGEIDTSIEPTSLFKEKYPFLKNEYYLSVSRALEDNFIDKLCLTFSTTNSILVLISNFDSSEYGKDVFDKFITQKNIYLINGLYKKDELDLVRRNCKAYIHTHTLCGTAPSLVEMIIAQRPILSVDVPQNRFTLNNSGSYFKTYDELKTILESSLDYNNSMPNADLIKNYDWQTIVNNYQTLY